MMTIVVHWNQQELSSIGSADPNLEQLGPLAALSPFPPCLLVPLSERERDVDWLPDHSAPW